MATREADDAELERAVGDELDDAMRVGDRERDAQLRVVRASSPSRSGTTEPPGPVDAPSSKRPVIALALGQLVEELLLRSEHALRVPVEPLPGLGRLDAAPGAVDELDAEPLLERPDLQAHGRLRDAEPLGRL